MTAQATSVEGLLPQTPDYYIQNPPRLPKKEIAEYLRSQGILVPEIYDSLNTALQSGGPFIVRSEHPQDYAGASGLIPSHVVSPDSIQQAREILQMHAGTTQRVKHGYANYYAIVNAGNLSQTEFEGYLKQDVIDSRSIRSFVEYQDSTEDIFLSEISYSYWQYIDGYNRTVIADTAIRGRYHIFTSKEHDAKPYFSFDYIVVEDGQVVERQAYAESSIPDEIVNGYPQLIEMYEKIRSLDRFSQEHCPIMEMQSTLDGEHYFLQTHRGQDERLATFAVEGIAGPDEIEATFVRGATLDQGEEVEVTLWNTHWEIPEAIVDEVAGFNYERGRDFEEIMTRRRRMQFIRGSKAVIMQDAADQHQPRSLVFKPGITVGISNEDYKTILESLPQGYLRACIRGKKAPVVRLHVISDGRRAIIRKAA